MTYDIKIGKPQQIGPLEVWPLILAGASESRYNTPPMEHELKFEEYDAGDGPRVSCIQVENLSSQDFLIPSGWIVGAELLQVRAFNRAEYVPAGHAILAEVSCVEKGRWSSGKNPVDAGRAPLSVMAAGWDFEDSSRSWKIDRETRQSRVWRQVSRQERRSGVRTTNSLEQIMREDSSSDLNLSRITNEVKSHLSTYDWQNGALIAYEGEPLLMEFYSNEKSAKGILRETLTSLAFDLDHFEFLPTSKSHVEAFIRQTSIGEMYMLSQDEWGYLTAGGNKHVDTKATLDSRHKIMNLTAIHRSHRLLLEV